MAFRGKGDGDTVATVDAPESTDVAAAEPLIDWSGVDSFDAAIQALQDAGIEAEVITEYGDGFILLPSKEKSTLNGVAFVIVDGVFRVDRETGRDYLSLRIITADGRKLVVNDGSVGLYVQAEQIARKRKSGQLAGLVVSQGLTGGEYTTVVDGETVKAATYYFAGV